MRLSNMATFNPRRPIRDPSIWFPRGMHVTRGPSGAGGDSTAQDEKIFIMFSGYIPAINRYLWTGKLLPTNLESYKLYLGIHDGNELSRAVWHAVERVLAVYNRVCTPADFFAFFLIRALLH